jgi:hypothetical protein
VITRLRPESVRFETYDMVFGLSTSNYIVLLKTIRTQTANTSAKQRLPVSTALKRSAFATSRSYIGASTLCCPARSCPCCEAQPPGSRTSEGERQHSATETVVESQGNLYVSGLERTNSAVTRAPFETRALLVA